MTSIRRELPVKLLLAVGICLAWSLGLPGSFAQTQSEQLPSSGPKPAVDETVIVPKKTQPAPHPAPEQKPEKINPKEIFTLSTSTNLVNVDVMVVDKNGNPIPTLGKVNFKLYDDGVPQSVTNFGTAEAPMTVCLLIEYSNKWWPFLYLALEYSYNFVQVIEPKDWVAVVSFDLKPQMLTDFTQDRFQVRSALGMLTFPGFSETNLYDALAWVIDRMKDIQGRKAIVVICTGIDTFSKLTYGDMLKIAKTSDAAIYPISILEFMDVRFDLGMTASEARNALNYIAQYSGGQAYYPRFEGELSGIYQQIAGQLRQQYSLGFIPTNPAHDGKYHKLKIELVDEHGNPLRLFNPKGKQVKYRIVAREGYYSPKS